LKPQTGIVHALLYNGNADTERNEALMTYRNKGWCSGHRRGNRHKFWQTESCYSCCLL